MAMVLRLTKVGKNINTHVYIKHLQNCSISLQEIHYPKNISSTTLFLQRTSLATNTAESPLTAYS